VHTQKGDWVISIGIATGYVLEGRGSIPGRDKLFLFFSTVSRPALGHTQSPTKWAQGSLSTEAERQRREAGHSYLTSAEVKNGGAIAPISHTSSWRGV
jgi:hypothetical protein